MAESAAHLRAGCYRCLEDGLALLDGRPDLPSRQRAFELALLLSARAKEIGLDPEPWIARAKVLAAGLPPAAAAADFLALVEALRRDPAGLDREQDMAQRLLTVRPSIPEWLGAIEKSSASAEAKTYLTLAGACGFFLRNERDGAMARAKAAGAGIPLMEYAIGSCTASEQSSLEQALEHEPRFDEAAYPLARYLANRLAVHRGAPDPSEAFARARAAFPDSPAIRYSEASFLIGRREWARALDGFDAVIALAPRHHDARLGRVQALSSLGRHDDAIAGATSLIDEGHWLLGEAYYWRAWNEFALTRLDESERDVEESKRRMRSSAVFVLSGLVQWRKQERAVAETELATAVQLAVDDCDAAGYLGGVRSELRKWLLASEAFAAAEACRQREVAGLEATLKELIAHEAPAAAIEAQQNGIATSEQQAAEMAYNRGVMLANAGDPGAALEHIERAGRHPSLQSKAAEWLQRLRARLP